MGAAAELWGQKACDYTCSTANSKKTPRRDYALVSRTGLPLVTAFRVLHYDDFPTHAVLQFKVKAANLVHDYLHLRRPKSVYELLREKCHSDFAGLDSDPSYSFCGPRSREIQLSDIDLPHKAWTDYLAGFHTFLDDRLHKVTPLLKTMLSGKRTDDFWNLWSETLEEAATTYAGLQHEDAKQYLGHGKLHVTSQQLKGAPDIDTISNTLAERNLPGPIQRLQRQALRCQSWGDRLLV